MNLIFKNYDKDDNILDFSKWLLDKIPNIGKDLINESKLIKWNNYINDNKLIDWTFVTRQINIKDVILGSLNNLRIRDEKSEIIIDLNPNIAIPNSYTSYISIAKLINNGNVDMNPYPIYDQIFNYVSDNFEVYYQRYLDEEV